MSVRVIGCSEALVNMRTSPVARWPKRETGENRIEPLAALAFTPSFGFAPGSTIFTIGSCFARHVEAALDRQGFAIPTRQFWSEDPTGRTSDNWMLDNYGVPAIFNEIAWAFGEAPYNPHDHCIELRPGLFVDAHLPGRVPLAPLEAVLARRQRIFQVTRSLLEADVLVMTLGLVEVWKDNRSGYYLNARPHQATLASDPKRFDLHVLSYEDVRDHLARTFEMVFRRCRADLKVILTVSPVPMSTTFTGTDVAVANQYSKSLLRAVAEEIVQRHARVDYFPSYENVVLSERAAAWEDDQVHVRPDLIEHNVAMMIAAYTGEPAQPTAPGTGAAAPSGAEHRDLKRARDYLSDRQYEKAIAASVLLFGGPLHSQALRVQATAHLALNQPAAAETALRKAITLRYNDGGLHGVLGKALLLQGKLAEASEALTEALNYSPGVPLWSALLAETLVKRGRVTEAAGVLKSALSSAPQHAQLKRVLASIPSNARE